MPPYTVSRRQLLKLFLASAAASALPASLLARATSPRAQSDATATHVLILGAGVAGLTAARLLHDAGYRVLLLEGRDRFGGRLWTNRTLDNIPLDMGASWIHGIDGNPLSELMNEVGVVSVPTDYDNLAVYGADGSPVSEDDAATYEDLFNTVLERAAEIAEASDIDLTLGAAIQQAITDLDEELDDNRSRALAYLINATIEHEFAASVNGLSAWNWESDEAFGGEDVIFPDGYDWLTHYLAEGLDIRLNTTVTEIRYDDQGVEITAGGETFTADYAIVTLPLGVLKAQVVTFDPPLPAEKQHAIQNLYMGVLNKLYLRFPDVFWDMDADVIGYVGEEAGQWAEFVNVAAVTGLPVLLCFNAGDYGLAIESMSDDQIIASAMQTLRTLYGADIPEPTGYLVTRWGRDPFSYGSYSSYGVNSTPDDRAALAETLADVLFFAGEATHSAYPGTVHGALLSGQRAAEALMESADS